MMRFRRYRFTAYALLLLVILVSGAAAAQETALTPTEAGGVLSQGSAAYRVGKLEDAAAHYQQLVDSGYDSPEILYNLGTVEARLNHKGRALGYLMKAWERAPRNGDIRFNLQKLRAVDAASVGAEDDAGSDDLSAEGLWYRVVFFLTLPEWLFLLWLLAMAVSGAILLRVFMKDNLRLAKIYRGIAWACGLFLLVLLVPVTGRFYYISLKRAVVVADTGVHSGPSSRFTENAQLSEGTVIRSLIDNIDGYSQVRLDNGQVGYVNRDDLLRL